MFVLRSFICLFYLSVALPVTTIPIYMSSSYWRRWLFTSSLLFSLILVLTSLAFRVMICNGMVQVRSCRQVKSHVICQKEVLNGWHEFEVRSPEFGRGSFAFIVSVKSTLFCSKAIIVSPPHSVLFIHFSPSPYATALFAASPKENPHLPTHFFTLKTI